MSQYVLICLRSISMKFYRSYCFVLIDNISACLICKGITLNTQHYYHFSFILKRMYGGVLNGTSKPINYKADSEWLQG